ncbi:MAG: WYL domain-containing protein [Propionibacteriaceae bacterium]|nr:WYL domain-containing protein [Propionibacteriaceae bacterium]
MRSAAQVARLLTLVPYLQQRQWVDLADVAEDFHVTKEQVLADLEVLVMCGLPGGLPDDLIEVDLEVARDEGVVNLRNAPDLRPLRFTRDEATSLIVAVEAVREVADAATAQAAQRVLDKLTDLVGDGTPPVSITVDAGDDAVRDQVANAIEQNQRLRLTYDGVARRETTSPTVDPVRIEVRDGASYLVAWALERQDWRTYRLDRIADVTAVGHPAEDHGLAPSIAGWFDGASDANIVTLDVDAEAAWVAEYYPTRDVTALPDGGARIVLSIVDPGWLTGLLLRLGPHVRAVDPPQAAADALAEAAAVVDQTPELGRTGSCKPVAGAFRD